MAPRRHHLFNPCSRLPRRLQIVASLTTFLLLSIVLLGSTSGDGTEAYIKQVPFGPQIQSGAKQVVDRLPPLPKQLPYVNAPHWLNPFRGPAHTPPPEQANSSSGEARWYSDFKWRNPFSDSVTFDEERAVLPPLQERPPVYTYFDPSGRRKDDQSKQAEQDLLQIWRRAWWAQGFRPVILGKPEAMNNPLYRTLQGLELAPDLDLELMRWLAWGNMGTGVLSNWLALPMAAYDHPLLAFMRRGDYPDLTRYEGLGNGIFVGSKDGIKKALKAVLASPDLENVKSVTEAVPADIITVDSDHSAIAFYSTEVIKEKYPAIRLKLDEPTTIGDGLAMLPGLINSHLHMTWQNIFSDGIVVLKPEPQHTTSLIQPAIDIARNLSQCPDTPLPASCPPNRPKCKPCVASAPMAINTRPLFRNSSSVFTIATVPHPYTLNAVKFSREDQNVKFIRRETPRDPWILAATKELLGTGLSSYARLVTIKDAVASQYGSHRSLWLTAEQPPDVTNEKDVEELDWYFGFRLPREPMDNGHSETPVPGPERRPPPPKPEWGDGKQKSDEELNKEKAFLDRAKTFLKKAGGTSSPSSQQALIRIREMIESWNLADTETWKFVRAWNARRAMERRKWEEEEEAFQGKGTFERWVDKVM